MNLETNCFYWFSCVSEVNFCLCWCSVTRFAWGQMHIGASGWDIYVYCFCVCVSACERGWWVKGGCWRENKHILRSLSSASTQVRPSACWGVRLNQMATHSCIHTHNNVQISAQTVFPTCGWWQKHGTGLESFSRLSLNLATNCLGSVWELVSEMCNC